MSTNKKNFFEKTCWRLALLIVGIISGLYGWFGDDKTIFLICGAGLIAVFLPSFFIQRILNELRKGIVELERMGIEHEKLKYIPKTLGEFERFLYYVTIYFLYPNNTDTFFIFLAAWFALKVYVENKIWIGSEPGKAYPFHVGRGKFLIYLIGNIISVAWVGLIFLLLQFKI